jgi:hypothetical protein
MIVNFGNSRQPRCEDRKDLKPLAPPYFFQFPSEWDRETHQQHSDTSASSSALCLLLHGGRVHLGVCIVGCEVDYRHQRRCHCPKRCRTDGEQVQWLRSALGPV